MSETVIRAFAKVLAAEENDAKRAALLQRAKMEAMGMAKEEVFEAPISTLGEYLETEIPIPPSLVWPTIVVRGEITATLGRAGKGKTTMNLCRLMKWAAGQPLFSDFRNKDGAVYLAPSEPLKVLIIENEGAAGMFHHKIGVMLKNSGAVLTDDERDLMKENISIWGDGGYSGLKLDDPGCLNKVRDGCEKVEPDIVFVEPLRSLWSGEENSSTEMANMVDCLQALATDFSCGVIISHHERKAMTGEDGELMSGSRGSSVLEGVVACMENFQAVKGGDYRELTWSKNRYLQPPPPTRFEFDSETNWYSHVSLSNIEQSIYNYLEENTDGSVKEISEELNEKQDKIRPILTRLVKDNRLKKTPGMSTGDGQTGHKYRIPRTDGGGLEV
jgi:hypothetical protein